MDDMQQHLLSYANGRKFSTILADPPWRFKVSSGKISPEHRRLHRYGTMDLASICLLPVAEVAAPQSHCYLWVPMALILDGLQVLCSWGFTYKTMLIWEKIRKDGQPDGRGCGFYFRLVTEVCLFGTRGKLRTLAPGRTQVNLLRTQKREHSRKPEELYPVIEACSPEPRLELFARHKREGWDAWGDQV